MITIIGSKRYSQIDTIYNKLLYYTKDVYLLDFEENSNLIIQYDLDEARYHVVSNGIPMHESKVVVFDPKYLSPRFGNTAEWVDAFVVHKNWRTINDNLVRILPGVKLNDPDRVSAAETKLVQLEKAHRHGFLIPPSIITNSTADVAAHLTACGSLITKALGDPLIPVVDESENLVGQTVLMTCELGEDLLTDAPETQPFPILVQENIEKDRELRIVVVNRRIFAFGVNPHQHPIMATDYRRGGYMVQYELTQMPEPFAERLLALHADFGLFSASYDFIVRPDGQCVFLEVNSQGVWAFIDKMNGGVVSDAMAEEIFLAYQALRGVPSQSAPVELDAV